MQSESNLDYLPSIKVLFEVIARVSKRPGYGCKHLIFQMNPSIVLIAPRGLANEENTSA
jgi:hypothetical protein